MMTLVNDGLKLRSTSLIVRRQEPVAGSWGRDGDRVLSDSVSVEVVEL
jgi:hypothetical protein